MNRILACFFLFSTTILPAEEANIEIDQHARELVEASGYRGCILVFDPENSSYRASHPEIAREGFIPASTFKILSTQAALQSGIVTSPASTLKWDGVARERAETNRDLDFTTAFRISSVPHYQAIVREIGPQKMQAYLDSIPYGNRNIDGGVDSFWLTGGLRISPLEQIDFLCRLHRDGLPFDPRVMDSVRTMMLNPSVGSIAYSAKTGWAVLPENRNVGWWVGWARQDERILFFATVLDSHAPRDDFGKQRIELTKEVVNSRFGQN